MKVEIWSDIICPFCYIGKRKFEKALNEFGPREGVEVVWRSFQLDPSIKDGDQKSVHEYLAERKGVSLEQAKSMNDYMTGMAREEGLTYHMDKAVVANTFHAHRLTHLAATHGLQDAAEERLFQAYFTEGKNIGDRNTLAQLGEEIGLPADTVKAMLEGDAYTQEVQLDFYEAQQVGARGVPFFVFNNRYAVSGAQPSEVFAEVLQKVWEETHPAAPKEIVSGSFCTTDGTCN